MNRTFNSAGNGAADSPSTPYTANASKAKRRQQQVGTARKGPLHMSDMVVAGNNCMVDHVEAAGNNASSRLKLNTMKMTTSLHSPAPLPSSKASFASQTLRARTAMGVFKEEVSEEPREEWRWRRRSGRVEAHMRESATAP